MTAQGFDRCCGQLLVGKRRFLEKLRWAVVIGLCAGLVPHQATAGVLTVYRADDAPEPGTLRDAVRIAASGDTITFSPLLHGQSIALDPSLGKLVIRKSMQLHGDLNADGLPDITIDGHGETELFEITRYVYGLVVFDGLILTRGHSLSSGGCLRNFTRGETLVANSRVEHCSAENDGGGILNKGDLVIAHSKIIGNTASRGAGLVTFWRRQPRIMNSVFANNHSWRWGGGIYSYGEGELEIDNTLIIDNFATGAGGGVFVHGSKSNFRLTIKSSTLANNTAQGTDTDTDHEGVGGAISTGGHGHFSLTTSTVSGNRAGRDGGGIILRNHGDRAIRHSTIVFNLADAGTLGPRYPGTNHPPGGEHKGGGVQNDPGVELIVSHSLFSENGRRDLPSEGGLPDDITGKVMSEGYNLFYQTDVQFEPDAGPGTVIGVGADLQPLVDNGGPTPTHMLRVDSVAADAGDPNAVAGQSEVPLYDQRGEPRVANGHIDIGAVEGVSTVDGSSPSPSDTGDSIPDKW